MADETPVWPAYSVGIEDNGLNQRKVTVETRDRSALARVHFATAVIDLHWAMTDLSYGEYVTNELVRALAERLGESDG